MNSFLTLFREWTLCFLAMVVSCLGLAYKSEAQESSVVKQWACLDDRIGSEIDINLLSDSTLRAVYWTVRHTRYMPWSEACKYDKYEKSFNCHAIFPDRKIVFYRFSREAGEEPKVFEVAFAYADIFRGLEEFRPMKCTLRATPIRVNP